MADDDEVMTSLEGFLRKWERQRQGFQSLLEAAVRRQRLLHSLAERRRSIGMTQPQVAIFMGTSPPAVARLEAGDGNPRFSTIERFAAAVGISIDWQLVESESGPAIRLSEPEDELRLGDLVRMDSIQITADTSLAEAIQAMHAGGNDVIVLEPDGETACGVITSRETVRAVVEGRDLELTPLSEVCRLVTVRASEPPDRAIELMLEHDLHCVPVIDADSQPVGMVWMADLMAKVMRAGSDGSD